MKDYRNMSDFEINKAVATALGMDVSGATEENNIMYGYVHDICNNPSDALPIIFENGISVCSPEHCLTPDEWWAEKHFHCASISSLKCKDKNPLRAAMIVYLMMKDEEK